MVRDGRDSVLSLLNVPWHHKNVARHAFEWNYRMKLTKRYMSEYPNNFLTVKFEDLIDDSNTILSKICDFIGEKYESTMLTTHSNNSNVIPSWEKTWKQKADNKVDISRTKVWKRSKNLRAINIMNFIMYNNLLKWGYECHLNTLSLPTKIFYWIKYNCFYKLIFKIIRSLKYSK